MGGVGQAVFSAIVILACMTTAVVGFSFMIHPWIYVNGLLDGAPILLPQKENLHPNAGDSACSP